MTRPTFGETVDKLVDLAKSDQELSEAPVDDIVDLYLVGVDEAAKIGKRVELRKAFYEKVAASSRTEAIARRITGRLM